MALFEFNALSVVLCGSFAARVFVPEMDKLQLGDTEHSVKYPALVLLHDEGGAAIDWQQTPAERCAAEHGIFIIALDVQHTLAADMEYGPKFETFISGELLGICRNIFPITSDPAQTWIGGVGTGAYGAVKAALRHHDVFSKAFSIDGTLDLGAAIRKAIADEETGIFHNKASLEAVFGNLDCFEGGKNDLFALTQKPAQGRFLFICEEDDTRMDENAAVTEKLGASAQLIRLPTGADCKSQQRSLPMAVRWVCTAQEAL